MAIRQGKRRRLRARDGDNCFYCDREMRFAPSYRKVGKNLVRWHPAYEVTVEHLVDRKHGGTSDIENLVLACKGCNNGRNYMTLSEKLASRKATWPVRALGGIV